MELRRYRSSDCEEMAALFYDTVHTINARDYTQSQLDAWADGRSDLKKWDLSFQMHYSLVAVEQDQILGFGDLDLDSGLLDRLYVHRDFQRRGIATALCQRLEQAAKGRVITHASITARPFFEKRGYRVIRAQQVIRNGILLRNYVMEKNCKEEMER